MKRIIFHVPLDKLTNNKIDIYATIILKDVKEVWVSYEENHSTGKLTGNVILNITQYDYLGDYTYVFKDAADAISLARELIEAVNHA